MTTKKCHACGIEKDTKDFYKSSASKDGLAPSCKCCQNGRTPTTKMESIIQSVKSPQKPKLVTLSGVMKTPQEKRREQLIYEGATKPKPSKDELIAKLEWEKAKVLTTDEPPKIIQSNDGRTYRIPTREEYEKKHMFEWDEVYGNAKCSVCHQRYKEGEEYVDLRESGEYHLTTRHVKCPVVK